MRNEHRQLQTIATQLAHLSKTDTPLHENVDQLCDLADQLTNIAADTMITKYSQQRAPLFPQDP